MRRAITACATVAILCAAFGAADAHAGKPKLSIADTSVSEPPGTTSDTAAFDVTLSKKARKTVRFDYATVAGGSATPVDDYEPKIAEAKIKRRKKATTVEVTVIGDTVAEPGDETFDVQLADPKNAKIDDGEATATIVDDDCSADTDADGIPDCVDECPSVSNPDFPCPMTIYAANDGTVPTGSDLTFTDVAVTASIADTFWVGVQPSDPEYDGVPNSGIEVDLSGSAIPDPVVGSRVRIEGTLQNDKIDADEVTVNSTGNGLTAHPVTLLQLATGSDLDAVLVTAEGLLVTQVQGDGDWETNVEVTIADRIIGTLPTATWQQPNPTVERVTGIAEQGVSPPEVSPRADLDLVPGVYSNVGDPCLTLAGGPKQRVVVMSGPVAVDTIVTTTSNHPEFASVPGSVTIPTGQSSTTLTVTPQGVGTVEINAALGNWQAPSSVNVKNSCP